ncbi:MAG TPA: prepilin-type cleavage/methylation domain-containing protein [Isosphaeraceae bacterium]|jgi:Tfp pilus assembly protein PilE|nr:prepilin-type cleavage/methylation domain-containing protein [Isosphaeraceae bacterium]
MSRRRPPRPGFSVAEALIVMTMMAVLVAISAPTFGRALEQSRLDVAAANLRAIWAAERLYRLDNPTFADLATLQSLGLVDPSIVAGNAFYTYDVTPSTDGTAFVATATRAPHNGGGGELTIDQTGALSGTITAGGVTLTTAPQ